VFSAARLSTDVPLKFRQCPKDVENEFPAGGGDVDVFGEALEANLAGLELCDAGDEVFEGAAKPVKLRRVLR